MSLLNFAAKRINFRYLPVLHELPLLIKLGIREHQKPIGKNPKNILVINASLVGDFIVSLPAIRQLIKKIKGAADIVVSPRLKTLAEQIRGVRNVYTASSLFEHETTSTFETPQENYDAILVMRISPDSYKLIKKIEYRGISSYLKPYLKYMLHLIERLITKRQVRQWRDVNFEIIGEKPPQKTMGFNDIFDFQKDEYPRLKQLPEFSGRGKKVLVHTGSGWPVKLWETWKWVEVLRAINKMGYFRFIFVGAGHEEQATFEEVCQKLNFKVFSLINRVDAKDLILAMKISDYFIGIDSGPRNMAHLADLPSLCLPLPGPRYFMPPSNRDAVIKTTECRCTNFFCYKSQTCLERAQPRMVLEGFKSLLNHKAN